MQEDSVDRHVAHWAQEILELDPLVEGVITRMQQVVRHLRQRRQVTIEAQGLEQHEYDTLHMLGGCGTGYQATPGEIAAWLRMSPGAITGRIDALERRGFVRRTRSPQDRRKVLVELTPEGRQAWRAAGREQGAEEARILDALDPAEREQLAGFLRKMMARIDRPGLLRTPPGADREGQDRPDGAR